MGEGDEGVGGEVEGEAGCAVRVRSRRRFLSSWEPAPGGFHVCIENGVS